MDHFDELLSVNELIESGDEADARDQLIQVLDRIKRSNGTYSPLVNHLIRRVGLVPYLQEETSDWQDRFALEAFKVDVGEAAPKALHREQSALLARLLSGESVAVSAPTSFGKSFVIDAFIATSNPKKVLIIVPTVALMDEARRRLHRKFGRSYQIVTTTDIDDFDERTIFIFPQERAITYATRIKELDLLVVDEFYKASAAFDKTRSPTLVRAILRFSSIAKQRYFLAPNISGLRESPFTKGMTFLRLDFNTVVLRKHDLSLAVGGDLDKKSGALREILGSGATKTMIYAGSHSQVALVGSILEASMSGKGSLLLSEFAEWLTSNYAKDWNLPRLVRKGVGLHNGQLHRSLSQIQVRLFEESVGLSVILSTSSMIEGVNTVAESVVVWNNKNGVSKLTDFDYRNILGRSGRMFKHFIGDVWILEAPPLPQEQQLELQLPDELLGMVEVDSILLDLSELQQQKAARYRSDMEAMLGFQMVRQLQASGRLQTSDGDLIKRIVVDVKANASAWNALAYLNSTDVNKWEGALYRAINLDRSGWDAKFSDVVAFVKVIASGWHRTIPEQIKVLARSSVGINDYFKLERVVSFKLSSLLGDVNAIHGSLVPDRGFDISRLVFRMAHAFLPPVVYQLEELGLPRMMSRKLQDAGVIDFQDEGLALSSAVKALLDASPRIEADVFRSVFERYIFEFFKEGVTALESPAKDGIREV